MSAVEGLRKYGFYDDADRVARKFVSMVIQDFDAHGTIVEKYDLQKRTSDLGAGIKFGYSSNQAGFGWTNAAVLERLAGMGGGARQKRRAALLARAKGTL